MLCGGSARLRRRVVKPGKSGPAAVAGNWAHYVAAVSLMENEGAVFTSGDRLPKPEGITNFKPSSFQRWMVRFYLETITYFAGLDMAIEVEAEFKEAFARFDLSGHADAFAINADATEAVGFDLKTGSELVDAAEDNAQVAVYIVLLFLAYPTLRKITFNIVQPANNPNDGFERVTSVTVEGEDKLRGLVNYIERELNHAIDHEDELNSDGWKQCRYCDAALICPAIKADLAAMKMKLTPEMLAQLQTEPDNTELVQLFLDSKKFTPIFDVAKEEVKSRLRAGPIAAAGVNLTLTTRAGQRTITDKPKAAELLAVLPDELYYDCIDFSAAGIEAALAKHEKLPKESKVGPSGKSRYKDLFGTITEQGTSEIIKVA